MHPGGDPYDTLKERLEEMDSVVGRDTTDRLVDVFLNHVPSTLQSCRHAIASKDAVSLRDAAHRAKSALSQFGTPELIERLQALEDLGDAGTTAQAGPLLEEIRTEFEALRRFYDVWLPARGR